MSGVYSQKLDPFQRALPNEPRLLVDTENKVLGPASKRACSEVVEGFSPLHRAFSLFAFNDPDELLLQQRSDTKITFPSLWTNTNTCCSHPLATPTEPEEQQQLGVRSAAQRRLGLKQGIPHSQARVEDINFVTRILYEAESSSGWGEHELDYILMLRQRQLSVSPSPEEVRDTEWVARDHLQVSV